MRRFPIILAASLAIWAAVAIALPWSPVQWTDAGTTFGPYAGDAGGLTLDGGTATLWASQPFVARAYSTSVHQTEACTASVLAAPSTVNASIQPQGSNDLTTWFSIGSPCVVSIDAGAIINASCGFDLTSGYPYQRELVTNSGSDAGSLSCTVAAF